MWPHPFLFEPQGRLAEPPSHLIELIYFQPEWSHREQLKMIFRCAALPLSLPVSRKLAVCCGKGRCVYFVLCMVKAVVAYATVPKYAGHPPPFPATHTFLPLTYTSILFEALSVYSATLLPHCIVCTLMFFKSDAQGGTRGGLTW